MSTAQTVPPAPGGPADPAVRDALHVLGTDRLLVAIHDPSYPSAAGEDTGRGSPYSSGAADFLRFCAALGFNGVQFGPQGQTSAGNPSPYDGTLFSRNPLSIDLFALGADPGTVGLVSPATAAALVADRPPGDRRVHHRYLVPRQGRALAEAYARFQGGDGPDAATGAPDAATWAARHALARDFADFLAGGWADLEPDALYDVLCRAHHGAPVAQWGDLERRLLHPAPGQAAAAARRLLDLRHTHAEDLRRAAFVQFLFQRQHRCLRLRARDLGLRLYGDLQIGLSQHDLWVQAGILLPDYRMGAPPSRTTPAGQPWGYAVLDPARYQEPDGGPGPALRFVRARLSRLLDEFDGLRIDHPHGLVCPWVYLPEAGEAVDPALAVQRGARLFCSPDLPDHPGLRRFAIAEPGQIDRGVPRYADGWVRALAPGQIARYSALIDVLVDEALARGRAPADLACEVLSTQPFPLAQVMRRHGLGRFRVTQKADLRDPSDVYRSENAAPADWIMVGTHDTPPLWSLLPRWAESGRLPAQAAYLAGRLAGEAGRPALAEALARDPSLLAQAQFADLFASQARSVVVFFADLLGMPEVYNVPGTISDDNWSLRVPGDYRSRYRALLARDQALNLPLALAMALRAPGAQPAPDGLLRRLDELAAAARGGA